MSIIIQVTLDTRRGGVRIVLFEIQKSFIKPLIFKEIILNIIIKER